MTYRSSTAPRYRGHRGTKASILKAVHGTANASQMPTSTATPRTRAVTAMDDRGLSPNELPSGCLASAPARRSVGTGYRAGDAPQSILARLFLRSCLTVRDSLGACPDELLCLPPRQERACGTTRTKHCRTKTCPPAGPHL